MLLNKFKRVILGTLGTQLLFIATFLIIFPVFPVRPLLKLIKLCYFNSSERLYNWFTHHSVFGSILNRKNLLTRRRFFTISVTLVLLLFVVMYVSDNMLIRLFSTLFILCTIIYNYYKTLK